MHTNKTPHYELPQFIGSDVPNPLTDFNDAMSDIDTNMYQIGSQAADIASDVSDSQSDIADLQSQANLTDDNITLLSQQTQAARQAATDAQAAANTNAGNIATLTQSVANNRSSIANYNTRFNTNVPFKFGIEEVEDPDNPGQMIDAYGFYTNDDPSEFVSFGEAAPDHGAIYAFTVDGVSRETMPYADNYNASVVDRNSIGNYTSKVDGTLKLICCAYPGTGGVSVDVSINGTSVYSTTGIMNDLTPTAIPLNKNDIIVISGTNGVYSASAVIGTIEVD